MPAGMPTTIKPNKRQEKSQKKLWVIQPPTAGVGQLAKSLKVAPLTAQILANRGITKIEKATKFLRPKLTQLIEPEKMPGVKEAVKRIKTAIENKEKITIYGDYDVDGITSVAILVSLLTLLGADADYYIPHRIDEGYGLNNEAIESLAKNGSKLIVTVDCGINSMQAAEFAGQFGIELIITDHHQPSDQLPQAAAIVHPAIEDSYANQDSAGAMVAYKLAWAIANEFTTGGSTKLTTGKKLSSELRDFMLSATSLAAMGTVADVMDLRGENRVLTSYGLKALPECNLCGVTALIESAGLAGKELDSFHIGFRLAPLINAAGRMGHARLAVELLISTSETHSMEIAQYLKSQNSQRQKCERKILNEVCEIIDKNGLAKPGKKSIVVANENWHSGVIGIVASRIVDRTSRPTVLINTTNGVGQGSARSIKGFNLIEAIKSCSQDLTRFGGHKMAAGVTLETKNIESFAENFEIYAQENLNQNDIATKLHIDSLATLGQFTNETVRELEMLAPFGQGNPRPIFATKAVRLCSPPRTCGTKNAHLQLAVTDGTASIRCIAFSMGKLEKKLLEHEFFSIAYEPQINTYNGSSNVQLVISDIQFEL